MLYQYEVRMKSGGTHYVIAEDYSQENGLYAFWVNQRIVRSFLVEEVDKIVPLGKAPFEQVR